MPAPKPATAHDKLEQDHLANAQQMELLGGDVDIDDFLIQVEQGGVGVDITGAITDIIIDRTTEGASTITVSCDDTNDRKIQRSGDLGHRSDVNVDGLWWTLAAFRKQGRQLQLVFEDRTVNVLRRYNSLIFAPRDKVTRAQFILRMLREVQEFHVKWVIPELNIKQDVSDLGPGQLLVGADGKALGSAQQLTDSTTSQVERGQGIPPNANLTVKGVRANKEQINIANTILQTAVSLHAPRKVMVCAIMTAITESTIHNYVGGLGGAVGVFQQTKSAGWPASRNVAVDAAAFLRACISLNAEPAYAGVADSVLCQAVQHSGAGQASDGGNYAPYQSEAEAFVESFDRSPSSSDLASANVAQTVDNATNLFMRGQITNARGMQGSYVLQPENTWNCMQRLAQEVNWRGFVVSGVVYFVSEHWLFKSKPFMVINEDSPGIDWIDPDYDEGKHKATLTITAHLSRWSCPPGSTILIQDQGIVDGKYLVTDIQRSMFNDVATVTAEKPLPLLPEPVLLSGVPKGFAGAPITGSKSQQQATGGASLVNANKVQKTVVNFAKSQLGVPYQWGAEEIGVAFDCSGLAQAAYNAAGLNIPRIAQAQYNYGRRLSKAEVMIPGDLVFFGGGTSSIEHVGIYIGSGTMIDAPHTGANVRTDKNFLNWTNPAFVGAARPWEHQ